jgi:putative salt-induced outer membrane protein
MTLSCAAAVAEPLPEPVAHMIITAAESADPAALAAVANTAKAGYPDAKDDIERLVKKLKADAETKRVAKLRRQRLYEGWSGEGEVGASHTSGSTNDTTLAIGMHAQKDGIKWRHKFAASAEYQRSNGVSGAEKYLVSYEANYKVSPRLYTVGLVQWEKDRFAGFYNRVTESVGLGYSIVHTPTVTWDATAGPAFRQTDLVAGPSDSTTELRLGTQVGWQLSPSTLLKEDAAVYVGGGNNTYQSITSLTAKVIGALAARTSFQVKKETSPLAGFSGIDTTSRLTLVYGF